MVKKHFKHSRYTIESIVARLSRRGRLDYPQQLETADISRRMQSYCTTENPELSALEESAAFRANRAAVVHWSKGTSEVGVEALGRMILHGL